MPSKQRRSRRNQPNAGRQSRRQAKPVLDPLSLARLLRQRKAAGFIIALVVIVAVAVLDRSAGLLPVADDWHQYHGQSFEVVRVIDGDTIDLRVADGERATTRVRLWGVDTPELAKRDGSTPDEPWAQEATAFTRETLEGQRVTLYLQEHRLRGGFGRLLAYVELTDGTELNAALIENGYSRHDDRWSHDQASSYDILERKARQSQLGVWSD